MGIYLNSIGVVTHVYKQPCGALVVRTPLNPGAFPLGVPGTLAPVQYVGIHKWVVLTLLQEGDVRGLIQVAADVPEDPQHGRIQWVGACTLRMNPTDLVWRLTAEFVGTDTPGLPEGLKVPGSLVGVEGHITAAQYWMVGVPALTREVMLNVDRIVITKQHRPKPHKRGRVGRPRKTSPSK